MSKLCMRVNTSKEGSTQAWHLPATRHADSQPSILWTTFHRITMKDTAEGQERKCGGYLLCGHHHEVLVGSATQLHTAPCRQDKRARNPQTFHTAWHNTKSATSKVASWTGVQTDCTRSVPNTAFRSRKPETNDGPTVSRRCFLCAAGK